MKVIAPDSKTIFKAGKNSFWPWIKKTSLFLAGTIDNGDSENWQKQVIDELSQYDYPELTIYNPRRARWNKNSSYSEMEKQISWEQEHLKACDTIIMVLKDNSKSPISLMELGQFCDKKQMLVFCTDKFYRFDNVKFICEANSSNVSLFKTTDIKDVINIMLNLAIL